MGLEIRLLDTAVIKKDGAVVKLGGKSLALLAYLLVTCKPHSREQLMDLLFDEAADPRGSLRWLVSDLRRKLGKEALLSDRQLVAFNFDCDHWLDLAEFENGSLDHYRGELLVGFQVRDGRRFNDWLFYEQERLRQQYENALAAQLDAQEQKGAYQSVIGIATKLLQIDNLNEA